MTRPTDDEGGRAKATYAWRDDVAPELSDCAHPWDRMDVTNNGDVLACCFAQENLGNILDGGLEPILSGERRRRLQDDVRHGRINPTCFNAPCIYAHASVRRPWTVDFPADRFTCPGRRADEPRDYDPARGDGLFVEGPWRYLPAASVDLTVSLERLARPSWIRPPGDVRLEVVDETGERFAQVRQRLTRGRRQVVRVSFGTPQGVRYRLGLKLWFTDVRGPVRFLGARMAGLPI